jgi:hypothetical integral membrane protein (TIGR02206 family)
MRAYSLVHLLWLTGIAGSCFLLAMAARKGWISHRIVRLLLAATLVGGELQRYFTDGMAFPDRLPLHLCNVTTWVAVLACLTLSPMACEISYLVGVSAPAMTLLMPDMGAAWPSRFFVNHGALIVTGVALVAGRIVTLRRGSVARAFGWFALYTVLMSLYNWRFGTNYEYLARKPESASLLDLFGPWPIYVVVAGVVALGLFYALWLPVRMEPGVSNVDAENLQGLSSEQAIPG